MEEENKEFFDVKTETKLLKAFSHIFKEEQNRPPEYPRDEPLFYMDAANVCGIVLKTNRVKSLFLRFMNVDRLSKSNKIPELNYNQNEKMPEIKSKYSIEYVLSILKCFSAVQDDVKFKLQSDYPVYFEGRDFDFVLAPKVDRN